MACVLVRFWERGSSVLWSNAKCASSMQPSDVAAVYGEAKTRVSVFEVSSFFSSTLSRLEVRLLFLYRAEANGGLNLLHQESTTQGLVPARPIVGVRVQLQQLPPKGRPTSGSQVAENRTFPVPFHCQLDKVTPRGLRSSTPSPVWLTAMPSSTGKKSKFRIVRRQVATGG